ncbi:hypothetical protein KAR34_13630 [bacterium]|nr:hypothetical protein [bacterium]
MSKPNCQDEQTFLKTIFNRPGLDTIDYRIGQYTNFKNLLFKKLNHDQTLAGWTHREADDPGIALLEGASILGDVLTFYQDLYANEAYLRSAKWRESIAELVRLTGYRLSPGVGGLASFAFELDSEKAVTIPKSFPVKIQLEDMDEVSDFETTKSLTAYPGLSKFNLYAPLEDKKISKITTEFYVDKIEGVIAELELAEDDQLVIGDLDIDNQGRKLIKFGQLITVESVRTLHDKQVFKMKGALDQLGGKTEVQAYKIKRSFNHVGHNAPPNIIELPQTSSDVPEEKPITYYRDVYGETKESYTSPKLTKFEFPLDQEITELTSGHLMIVEAYYNLGTEEDIYDDMLTQVYLERTISKIRKGTITWGALTSPGTIIRLDKDITTYGTDFFKALGADIRTDIRSIKFHEVENKPMTIKAVPQVISDTKKDELIYYGEESDAAELAKRSLFLQTEDDEQLTLSVSSVSADSTNFSIHAQGWKVKLTTDVDLDGFEHKDEPLYSVYGNIVSATQGKTMAEVALGNGDARQTFQTFKLPKAPLTYLLDGSATPPEVPETTITVDGEAWTWVSSLFNYSPKDKVYITREDEDDNSYVQFGDGKTGAKLTSGVKNVKIVYRKGVAAYGEKKAGAKAQAGTGLDGLDKVHLAGTVSMGAEAEEGDNAKEAAPGKLQSLGRLVSIKDYEHEVLSMSGVAKVKAGWTLEKNIPLLKMWVLMESDEYDKLKDVRALIDTYNKSRGLNRHPIKIEPGLFQYVRIHAVATVPNNVKQADIEKEIKLALGVSGEEENDIDGEEGLFGIKNRSFSQDAYANNVLATIQNVKHVLRVELKSFHTMICWPLWPDYDSWIESITYVQDVITAPESDVLALYKDHLKIQFIEENNT